ncbi:MAG: ParA family protein, partial [Alphaproteobacteria bacterium]|nr:ParA family protein [Alphaproteobacteria bacterium]
GIIVPLQCEFYALEGLSQLTKTVKLVQKHYNPSLDIHGIVLTMYDRRNRITKLVDKDVRGYFKDKVYNTTIPRNVRLSEAPSYGLPGIIYDMKSPGAQGYIKLAREILGKDKPVARTNPSNQSETNTTQKKQTEVA